jgi:hypothetical protein
MKVAVKPEAEAYVRQVVAECTGEVGGLGYCTREEDGTFLIYKFVVLSQEASSSGVDFDDDAQHEELQRAAEAGEIDCLRVSWHSHGGMGTFYSSTDEDAIRRYQASGVPYLVSLVYNRKGEVKPRLDVFDSETVPAITFDKVDYEVLPTEEFADIREQAKADAKRLVRTWTSSAGKGSGGKKNGTQKNGRSSTSQDSSDERPWHIDADRDEFRQRMEGLRALASDKRNEIEDADEFTIPDGYDVDAHGIIGKGRYNPLWDLIPLGQMSEELWTAMNEYYATSGVILLGENGAQREIDLDIINSTAPGTHRLYEARKEAEEREGEAK